MLTGEVRPVAVAPGDDVYGSTLNESLLTGEARPVAKARGDDVYGGTRNARRGMAAVRATAVGVDAALSRIMCLVDDAQTARAPIGAFSDRVSGVFVPVVVAIAVAIFAVWFGLAAGGVVPDCRTFFEGASGAPAPPRPPRPPWR